MKKGPEIFDDELDYDDIDISNLISPRCDFHVGPDFKQKLMEEARAMPRRHYPLRRLPYAASTAAAVAALIAFSVFHFLVPHAPVENPLYIATSVFPTSDNSLERDEAVTAVSESSCPIQEKNTFRKSEPTKVPPSNPVENDELLHNEDSKEIQPGPVTEGEMPLISEERPQDPDEIRVAILARRRNAGIAYIESVRDEIAANQAYIMQLMSETNVSQ